MRFGTPQSCIPSRFLDEIPDEMLEIDDRSIDPFGMTRRDSGGADRTGDDDGFEAVFDDEPSFDYESRGFEVGEHVRHNLFGPGRIVAVRKAGGATRVTVDFFDRGRKELSLEFARLERVQR